MGALSFDAPLTVAKKRVLRPQLLIDYMGTAKVTEIGPLQRYKEWKLSLKINGLYEFESLHSDHFKMPQNYRWIEMRLCRLFA